MALASELQIPSRHRYKQNTNFGVPVGNFDQINLAEARKELDWKMHCDAWNIPWEFLQVLEDQNLLHMSVDYLLELVQKNVSAKGKRLEDLSEHDFKGTVKLLFLQRG